jgi:hypothetical protein
MKITYNISEKMFCIENIDYENMSMIKNLLQKKIQEIEFTITEMKLMYKEVEDAKFKDQMGEQIAYFRTKIKGIQKNLDVVNFLINSYIV